MIINDTLRKIVNFALFQLGWFLCVIFPGMSAAAAALVLVVVHLVMISQKPGREIQFILLGTVLGSLLDGLWFRLGILLEPGMEPLWTPIWLIGVWALFMTTLAHSLAWMGTKKWLPFAFAPFAGPFAYWSAAQLGAVELPQLVPSLLALALGWGLIFPLLMAIKKRYFPDITP